MARRRLTQAQPGQGTPAPGVRPRPTGASAPPIAQVAGQSAEAAALQQMIDGIEAARADGRMLIDVPLEDIAPDHLARDRIALDPEAIAALKASIASHGQRTPIELTPLPDPPTGTAPGHRYGLISGWRRVRALSELFEETGAPRFATVRALLRQPQSAGDAYVAMVEENELRVGLSYYERARVVAEATARGVFPDHPTALRTLFATASRAKRSKIASFIDIHDALGEVLRFPAMIPERLGLALVAKLRRDGGAEIRQALTDEAPDSAAAEQRLLARFSASSNSAPEPANRDRKGEALEALRPGLAMAVKRRGKKLVVTLSGEAVDETLSEAVQRALRSLP